MKADRNTMKYRDAKIILKSDSAYRFGSKFSTPRSSSQRKIYLYSVTISGCKKRFANHLHHHTIFVSVKYTYIDCSQPIVANLFLTSSISII